MHDSDPINGYLDDEHGGGSIVIVDGDLHNATYLGKAWQPKLNTSTPEATPVEEHILDQLDDLFSEQIRIKEDISCIVGFLRTNHDEMVEIGRNLKALMASHGTLDTDAEVNYWLQRRHDRRGE
jgi:hypothetical protein